MKSLKQSVPRNKFSINDRFSRLVVILKEKGSKKVLCRCDCGKEVLVWRSNLATGNTKSCGCFFNERVKEFNVKHGHAVKGIKCITFSSWNSMKARCYIPSSTVYSFYGGRGIKVCDEWLKDFNVFLNDMGERPSIDHTLDRIDHNGDYNKENCRWATKAEQAKNRRKRIDSVKNISCSQCRKEFRPAHNFTKFCSRKCFGLSVTKKIKLK